ncbi:hypothetical protein ACF1BN_15175 [Streptomyces sp. NPDC014861]|uniref:hypothetical protein n=1 Tax=Streptomyces sp. NPDC014861 TaxID=3364923 RepID=UPI0036FE71B4
MNTTRTTVPTLARLASTPTPTPTPTPAPASPYLPALPFLPASDAASAPGFAPSPGSSPAPASVPAQCEVPEFAPLRVRGGRFRPRLRRAPGALLLLTAAALALTAALPGGTAGRHDPGPRPGSAPAARSPVPAAAPAPAQLVSAPVRIADAQAVRLLRAGDRVDVIAAPSVDSTPGEGDSSVRVVARSARVAEVPHSGETRPDGGALIVLAVPRATATALAGAGVTSQLAVTLC